mgnify:CR=1 FL=1
MDEVVKDRKKQIRRYAIALIAFLVLIPGMFSVTALLGVFATSVAIGGLDLFIAAWGDPEVAKIHVEILYVSLPLGVLGTMAAWYTWDRVFLRSGYLNAEMVALLDWGHMPGRAETWRKRVGYVLYSFIFGSLSLALYFDGDLVLALIPFAITVYTVVHAWRSSVWRKRESTKGIDG